MKNKGKFFAIGLITLLFLQTSIAAIPNFGWIKGSGNVVKETREVSGFHGIEVGGAFEVVLVEANTEKVVLEMDDNLLPYVKTRVFGGILEIDNDRDFRNPSELKVTIYFKSIDNIDISGAASLISDDVIKAESLEFEASGASDVQLQLAVERLEADLSGASKVSFSGKARYAELETSGAAVYKALELETEESSLDASGAAVARIWVTEKFAIEASGASSVRYKGNPGIDIIDISGASSVRKY